MTAIRSSRWTSVSGENTCGAGVLAPRVPLAGEGFCRESVELNADLLSLSRQRAIRCGRADDALGQDAGGRCRRRDGQCRWQGMTQYAAQWRKAERKLENRRNFLPGTDVDDRRGRDDGVVRGTHHF